MCQTKAEYPMPPAPSSFQHDPARGPTLRERLAATISNPNKRLKWLLMVAGEILVTISNQILVDISGEMIQKLAELILGKILETVDIYHHAPENTGYIWGNDTKINSPEINRCWAILG